MERIIPCIPPTLDGWVYIEPIHVPLGGPLYTWVQYTPTKITLDKCHKRIIKTPDEFNLKGKIHDCTMENTNSIKCINFMSIM